MVELTKGWKGYAGAAILIAAGLYLLVIGEEIAGIEAIGLGLGLLGIRHKLDYSQESRKK